MARKFTKDLLNLRTELWEAGIRQKEVAKWLGLCESTTSDLLNGRQPLTADRAAEIRKLIAEWKV